MNVHGLATANRFQRDRFFSDRWNLYALWAHEQLFADEFAKEIVKYDEDQPRPGTLVDFTFSTLIQRPGDLVALCRRLPYELRSRTASAYVDYPSARNEVLTSLGGSAEVFRELPHNGAERWAEASVLAYAWHRLRTEPDRKFELHELLPFGTVEQAAAAAVISGAYESGRLSESAGRVYMGPPHFARDLVMPMPAYAVGDRVHVVVNERNRTPHRGVVRDLLWHVDADRWYFFLRTAQGSKVSKRYTAEDLAFDVDPSSDS